jgi:outer membrane protein assembly factor BamB
LVVCIGLLATAKILPAQSREMPLIPRTVAERSGLVRAWYLQLPLDPAKSKITRIRFFAGLILAVTDEGMLHVVNAESGQLRWSFQAGDRGKLVLAGGANATHVAVANTSTLFVLDRASGNLIYQRELTGTPERGPVLTEHHVILPLVKGPLEVYPLVDADKKLYPSYLPSAGRVIGHPAVSGIEIAWAGDLNRIHGHQFADLGATFDSPVGDGISTGATIFSPNIYIGTEGGYLIAFDAQRGDEVWKFAAGSPIKEMPIALGSVIYVLAQDGGIFAVKPDHGTQLWSSPDPARFVSASPDRVYTIDRFGRLAILDAKTGARVGTMPLPQMTKPLPNDQSDRLLLYTDRGFIQCLHEAKLTEPHLYIAPLPQVKAKNAPPPQAKPVEAQPAAAEPAAAPAAEPMPAAGG